MDAGGTSGRLLTGLALLAVLAGCGTGASSTPTSAVPTPPSAPSVAVAAATPTTVSTLVVTTDLPYESANALVVPGLLDVYAPVPAKTAPLPVVVMFHGFQGDKSDLRAHAREVADLGFVVFAPTWAADTPTYDGLVAAQSQAACAVEFARAHAAEYGGDPTTIILFGHSAGASIGARVAFARPTPPAGCLGGTTLGPIDALVTWEGDWMVSVAQVGWDSLLAADARALDVATPWPYLARHKDLKVVMLVSEHPGAVFERRVGDPWAPDSWLAVRDPSGVLRRQLEANGALADGVFDFVDGQQLLYSVLKAQGNPVSLDVMPGSTHDSLSSEGWKVFLAAFGKAVAKG